MAPAEPAATVIPLGGGISLGEAATAFLARRDLDADTLRSYAQTMTVLVRELGEATPASAITGEQVAATASKAWEHVAARTWNRHRAAIRSFSTLGGRCWPRLPHQRPGRCPGPSPRARRPDPGHQPAPNRRSVEPPRHTTAREDSVAAAV